MKLMIKNMVCNRCRMAVMAELQKTGIAYTSVSLGEIELPAPPVAQQLEQLRSGLHHLGFAIIDDRKTQTIEKIKNEIIHLVHHADSPVKTNLSDHLSARLNYDYTYLSNLFSEVEGLTIEKYFIAQRIEKVKELLVYGQLTLSEIADKLGYSSVAYLSSQFRKVTGLTPSYFKILGAQKRRSIDNL